MNDTSDQQLFDLSPSAKLVFVVLSQQGPLTQKRIATETRLSQRTVRYAIRQLEEINVISSQINFKDARQTLYSTDSDDPQQNSGRGENPCQC